MDLLAEGVVGGVGGFVGRMAAFPFDTLKVKLATGEPGLGVRLALRRILAEEGVLGLYRGLPFSVVEGMYQKFLYVYLFSTMKQAARRLAQVQDLSILATLCCGYVSDLGTTPFSMPIEAMVVRLQSASAGASRAAIVRDALFTWHGLLKAWKSGAAYIVLSLKAGMEFALFDWAKNRILQAKNANNGAFGRAGAVDLSAREAFGVGAVARAIATCVVFPFVTGKALSQAQLASSALAGIRQVLHTEGPLALYKGLGMELSRGVTQAAVMFTVMERIRSVILAAMLQGGAAQRKTP